MYTLILGGTAQTKASLTLLLEKLETATEKIDD